MPMVHNLPATPAFRDEKPVAPISEFALRVVVELPGWQLYAVAAFFGGLPRSPCVAEPPGRCQGRQDQHRGGLQGRPADPVAGGFRQAGGTVRPACRVLRVRDPVVQYHHSMGRLTLNVLLSFAQFEREVIGERVRDKIAASKRKGIWVGGPVP